MQERISRGKFPGVGAGCRRSGVGRNRCRRLLLNEAQKPSGVDPALKRRKKTRHSPLQERAAPGLMDPAAEERESCKYHSGDKGYTIIKLEKS